jgi:hypothetical protein
MLSGLLAHRKSDFSFLHFKFYGRKKTNFMLAVDCGDDGDGDDAVSQR